MAGKAKKHPVDGGWMSVPEAAEMLGITPQQIYGQMTQRECGLQAVVNMYRDGMILGQGRAARHMVDGRWMTVQDAADMLGITRSALRDWMYKRRKPNGNLPTLTEAVEAYRTGQVSKHHGHIPTRHKVGRKTMTIQEAADMLGVSYDAVQQYMYRHKTTLAKAIKYHEGRKRKKAEREIMKILGF